MWPNPTVCTYLCKENRLGPVARSEAHAPGMQTVTDSILKTGNIFPWRLGSYQLLVKGCALSAG